MTKRSFTVNRQTLETQIELSIALDGEGNHSIDTPVPFLSHMLAAFTGHGLFDLSVQAKGDTEIDDHHTTEDIGICLGKAICGALGDKQGVRRFGTAFVPMDDALAQVTIDLGNRPYFVFQAAFPKEKVGSFDTELVREFFEKLAMEVRMNLHIILHYGANTHHMIEAIFKAFSRALDEATALDPRVKGIPSTKGVL